MDKEQELKQLKKAMNRVKIADRIRFFGLLAVLVLVLLIFFGNKVAAGAAWYAGNRELFYLALFLAVLILFTATVARMFLAAMYNRLTDKQNKVS